MLVTYAFHNYSNVILPFIVGLRTVFDQLKGAHFPILPAGLLPRSRAHLGGALRWIGEHPAHPLSAKKVNLKAN